MASPAQLTHVKSHCERTVNNVKYTKEMYVCRVHNVFTWALKRQIFIKINKVVEIYGEVSVVLVCWHCVLLGIIHLLEFIFS